MVLSYKTIRFFISFLLSFMSVAHGVGRMRNVLNLLLKLRGFKTLTLNMS